MLCYKCGQPADMLVDGDTSAICEPCEEKFQAAMRAEFPHGQCWQCGAAYHEDGLAPHVEGACSQWRDSAYD